MCKYIGVNTFVFVDHFWLPARDAARREAVDGRVR